MFGPEDSFLNWFGEMVTMLPVVPLVNNGENLTQPVYSVDVGKAIMSLIYNWQDFQGSTVLLGGPETYSYKEIIDYVLEVANLEQRVQVGVPTPIMEIICKLNQLGMNPTFTEDNLLQMLEDNTITEERKRAAAAHSASSAVYSFADLGITPTDMRKVSYDFLHRFRSGGHFRRIQGYH